MKTVIYHSADFDGICCREIAKLYLWDETYYIGWNFGDPPLTWTEDDDVLIMDLPPDEPFGLRGETPDVRALTWIDHHKSAIGAFSEAIPGFRIDGVAACRLAWQWFGKGPLPTKEEFINRTVSEPWAVRLIGEFDVWDKRDPDAERFQLGLRAHNLNWNQLFESNFHYYSSIFESGSTVQQYFAQTSSNMMEQRSFLLNFEDLKFLACDGAKGSLAFASRDIPETGHDALMAFYFNGIAWIISLYHARHRTDLDLSLIAQKYGGGGHRGACGFRSKDPIFIP